MRWGGILTSNTTAENNTRYGFNASGGTFTISAPSSPAGGTQFGIVETAEDETGITISGNGNNIWDPIAEEYVSSFVWKRGALNYVYDGTNWTLARAVFPKHRRRRFHGTEHSPVGLYQLDSTSNRLTDSSGNGRTLTEDVAPVDSEGYILNSRSSVGGRHSQSNAAFQITGAVTIAALIRLDVAASNGTVGDLVLSCTGNGETEVLNTLYGLHIKDQYLQWFHEHSTGTNDIVTSDEIIPLGDWHHICGTRPAAGTSVKLFIDGVLVQSGSTTAPSGGSSSSLYINEQPDGNLGFDQPIASAIVIASELSDAQVASLAKSCGFQPLYS